MSNIEMQISKAIILISNYMVTAAGYMKLNKENPGEF